MNQERRMQKEKRRNGSVHRKVSHVNAYVAFFAMFAGASVSVLMFAPPRFFSSAFSNFPTAAAA